MSWRVWMWRPGARIVASAAAMLAVGAIAAWALSPAQPGPQATAVGASEFFDSGEIERGEDYRGEIRAIALLALAVELGLLAFLAVARPRRLRTALARAERRPLLGAAAVGAAISVAGALAVTPVGLWAHELAVDVGLSVQGLGGWLFDRVRGVGIDALFAAVGALLLVALQRRLPRAWWVAGAGVVLAFALFTSYLNPVVLAPIFNDFEPLEDGPRREAVLDLAERAEVDVGEVYVVDASSRRTSLNAYVDGIGSTRRVVIYDNLVDDAGDRALLSVVAHELAHARHRDIPRGLLFVALVAPLGMLFVREAGGALAARTGTAPGCPAALPAYALAIAVAALALGIVGNQLSRAVEERADRFALELTADPGGLIDLQTQLTVRNVKDPDPPGWWRIAFSTHPSTVERLGLAKAFEEQR